MDREAVARQRLVAEYDVSRETLARLDLFASLLRTWQGVKNLVAPSTLAQAWERHILDSAQVLPLVGGSVRRIADFGSGAGFPGLVLAILLDGRGQRVIVDLVESNGRKAAFLREVTRQTAAPARVQPMRIDDYVRQAGTEAVDLVTARALAPLAELLSLGEDLLKTGASALFLKGQDAERELTDAAKSWRLHADLVRSVTDPSASIVHVTSAERIATAGERRIGQ